MKLFIDRRKIEHYLLNRNHPDGGGKAKFFYSFGFDIRNTKIFEKALITHYLLYNEECEVMESEFGSKFIIKGDLETPIGRSVLLKSIWLKPHDSEIIKLVTVYPI